MLGPRWHRSRALPAVAWVALSLLCSDTALAGHVEVVSTHLSDNGDDDGFADTGEEVEMRIRISNKTGIDLSGVTARLATNDPNIECVSNSLLNIGTLLEDEILLSSESFTFKVADGVKNLKKGR